jgi:O-antigen/teichoic acid export membrane protein
MRKTFYINSFTGGVQLVITTVLVFFTLPIFINKLGLELYGVFSLILLIGNINTFVNLGLNAVLIKYLAEQGKCIESDHDILVAYLILLVILLPITLICIYYYNFVLLTILRIPLKYYNTDTVILYILVLIANIPLFIGQISTAIIDAQQKIYITNILQTLYNFLYWGLLLLAITLFNDLKLIGWGFLLSSLVWFIAVIWISIKTWGKISFVGLGRSIKPHIKKQLSYSLKLYLTGVINFFYEPFSKILLAQFVGVGAVGILDISLRVKNQIWNLILRLLYPIFPYISQLTDIERIKSFVNDVEQKIAFLILPLLCTIIFCTRSFIVLWLRKDVEIISSGIIFITSAYLATLVVVPIYQYFQAKGHPGKTVLMQIINVLINGVVFFVFYRSMGYYAIIISNSLAILSSVIICVYYQRKLFNSLIFSNISQLMKFLAILIMMLLAGTLVNKLLPGNLTKLLFFPLFFLLISVLLFRFLKIFNSGDVKKYIGENYLQRILSRILITN